MRQRFRQTRNGYCNCNVGMFPGVGAYDVPELAPVDVDLTGCSVIGFDRALSCKRPEDKIVHFFMDDYKFETCWLWPRRYIDNLKRFRAVIGPDFSSYTDFPWAVQVFNHYRRQWLARFWQDNGVTIIPDVQFGYDDGGASFDYCLDGIPSGGLICTSTLGGFRSAAMREMWLARWREMLDTLKPEKVLLFGKRWPGIDFAGELIVMDSDNISRMEARRNVEAENML